MKANKHCPVSVPQHRLFTTLLLSAVALLGLGLSPSKAYGAGMLHASGRQIVDANGNVVQLRGFNLGGWFIMEKWMAPLDSGSLPDTFSVMQTLDSRFGVATEQSLIRTYQQSWISTTDLDNIKNAGYNVVRVPVWWGQFYALNNVSNAGWRSDAFTELDWLVSNCASRGIYVIIDMHGAVGGQSTSDDTGQAGQNTYWTNGSNQGNTAWMWWQIASHYNGNATVAGYDLLNEPDAAPSNAAVISAYVSLYSTVRSADPNHMIFIEGTFGSWNWSMLPAPSSEGWTNVVYEMHEYQWNNTTNGAAVDAGSQGQVNDFNNHASYNVPGYVGEFNDFGTGAGTWQTTVNDYNNGGLSWTMWSYKATAGLSTNSWGWFDPTFWPTTPNISSDSSATISSDWQQWTTSNAFAVNTTIGLGTPSSGGGGTGISSTAWYNVINQTSNLCVDDANQSTANGSIVQQFTCGSGQTNQEWQFVPTDSGYYRILNRNAAAQNEVWDVTGGAGATGTGVKIQTWAYGGGTNQQWLPVSLGGGYYKMVTRNGGLCLDVPGASTATGVQLQQYTCNGTGAQAWRLVSQP